MALLNTRFKHTNQSNYNKSKGAVIDHKVLFTLISDDYKTQHDGRMSALTRFTLCIIYAEGGGGGGLCNVFVWVCEHARTPLNE